MPVLRSLAFTAMPKTANDPAAAAYPIKAKGSATFSDSPIAADRMRIANERARNQNIEQFLQALR